MELDRQQERQKLDHTLLAAENEDLVKSQTQLQAQVVRKLMSEFVFTLRRDYSLNIASK